MPMHAFERNEIMTAKNIGRKALFTVEDAKLSTLGIDVVMFSVTQMLDQVARFFLRIDLYVSDAGVCHVA